MAKVCGLPTATLVDLCICYTDNLKLMHGMPYNFPEIS